MPLLDRNGVKLKYEVHGQGPAVLLSHGYCASSTMWLDQAAALRDSHRVILWDMRGHGESDSPDSAAAYSEDLSVDDMAAVLDACGVDSAVVGGFSLGGYMSLAFQHKYPGRVQALVLVNTGPGFKNPEAQKRWNDNADKRAEVFESRGLEALELLPELRSKEMQMPPRQSAIGLGHVSRTMLKRTHDRIIRALDQIAVPTLIIVGAEDIEFVRSAEYMAGKIPRSEKLVIEKAGHASNLHQPEIFNGLLKDFLARCGAGDHPSPAVTKA